MNTIETSTDQHAATTNQNSLANLLTLDEDSLEFNRYGIISVGILLIGIVGGLTVGLSASQHLWQIAVIAISTMIPFSLMLAVAPMKWVMRTLICTLALDLIIVALNFLI